MRRYSLPVALAPLVLAACATGPTKKGTLAELRNVRPDVQEMPVEQSLDKAMSGYRRYLDETPETTMTPEAMRRLADLQIEKQFGIRAGDGKPREMAAPERALDSPDGQEAEPGERLRAAGDVEQQDGLAEMRGHLRFGELDAVEGGRRALRQHSG